jgi:hypothetical protein
MALTIFFSWQVDRPDGGERRLIEDALSDAVRRLMLDASVEPAIREEGLEVDRDTKGVAGTPPIVDTIFGKINRAGIFVPDLTFVGARADGRPSPNPNVLIEYGWALKSLTHARMMPVMNTHYGEPTAESMPFDMRHLRHPIRFNLPPGADATQKRAIRAALSKELEAAIKTTVKSPEFATALPKPPAFPAAQPREGQSRFRLPGAPLGKTFPHFAEPSKDIFLAGGSATWLRLMPVIDPGRQWSPADLRTDANKYRNQLRPLGTLSSSSLSTGDIRAADGFGFYMALDAERPTPTVTYVFRTGEVWGIDTYHPSVDGGISLPISELVGALTNYATFLRDCLGINPPYQCIVGIEGAKDRPVWLPHVRGRAYLTNPFGSSIEDVIVYKAVHEDGAKPFDTLRGFFAAVLESCGVTDMSILSGA